MVRNWGYVQSDEDIGELYITKNQYMGGNMAGVISKSVIYVMPKPLNFPYGMNCLILRMRTM